MTHKCIICHKEFENDDSLKKHVDEHLSESVLSKPQDEYVDIGNPINEENKPINFKKIFSEEKFEKLIESKINQISDVQEIIEKRNFVEQIKKISQKNPFCYPGYFLDDYFAGMSTVDLQEKYHIWFWMDIHNITHNILKLSETRYTSRKYDENEVGVAKSLNLKIVDWKEKYETFQENSEFFKDEINSLFFDNILQAEILFYLMDDESTVEEIIKSCKNLQEHYDLFHFIDSNHFGKNKFLINSFDEILENDLDSGTKKPFSFRNFLNKSFLCNIFTDSYGFPGRESFSATYAAVGAPGSEAYDITPSISNFLASFKTASLSIVLTL